MGKDDRLSLIIKIIDDRGAVSYQELEKLLDVSIMTVRRDIDFLASKSKLIKTLGGAQRANAQANLYESSLMSRLSVHNTEKRAIAAVALELIKPNETIYLDGSTTCLELAKALVDIAGNITVVTNSMLIYMELTKTSNHTVLCIGGQHDPASFCLIGPQAEEQTRKYFVDKAFFSTKGFIPSEGTFESSVATFRIKQLIAKQCKEVVLLVDHSKLGQRALCKVLDIDQINTIITDSRTNTTFIDELKNRGISVHVAESKINDNIYKSQIANTTDHT